MRTVFDEENLVTGARSQSPNDCVQQILLRWLEGVQSDGGLFSPIGMCVPSQNLKINIPGVQRLKRGCAQSRSVSPANTEENNNNITPMQGQLINPEVEVARQEVTVFSNEGATATAQHVEPSQEPNQMELAASDLLTNDVIGFLERPILYETVDWNSTTAAGTRIASTQFPRDWLSKPMIREKLAGFMYLRCDFEYTVQVNAQPFNAGRLLIVYEPLNLQLTEQPSSIHHFGGLTGYRHVDLDLAVSTAATLEVPYHPIMSHHDLVRGNGTQGRVGVYVYSPLTGLSEVDFTVWIKAKNVRVEMPTGLPLHAAVPPLTRGVAEANLSAEKKRPGNIETISRVAGKVAKMASGIPGIGGIATAGAVVADAVAGVASLFGWSKPADPEFPTKVEVGYGRYTANANGDSKSKSLALDARNAVQVATELANTSEDEMAIKTIISRPVFLSRFAMLGSESAGSLLFDFPVCPTACEKEAVGTMLDPVQGVIHNNTYLSYLSNLFTAYRGGLKYTFKIVKTAFHSGRIEIVFVPGASRVTDPSTVDKSKVYRAIYDLRETSEIEFEVPFIWNTPWKSIRQSPEPNLIPLSYTEPTGYIYVFVVNALRNPSTCADHIDFIVEVSAADDFQFAGPMRYRMGNETSNIAILRANEFAGPISSGTAQADFIPMRKSEYSQNAHGAGEVIESLRFLLKRYTSAEFVYVNPLTIYQPSWEGTTANKENLLTQKQDDFTWIMQLFRFMTGSMRLAIMPPNGENFVHGYTVSAEGFGMTPVDALTHLKQRGNVYQFPVVEPFLEISVPFYQQTPAIPTPLGRPGNESSLTNGFFDSVPYNQGTSVTVSDATTGQIRTTAQLATTVVLRALGEDFSFSYLVGPPRTGIFYPPTPP